MSITAIFCLIHLPLMIMNHQKTRGILQLSEANQEYAIEKGSTEVFLDSKNECKS